MMSDLKRARQIADVGRSFFLLRLDEKAVPRYTSQECSNYGERSEKELSIASMNARRAG
ncbi:MAG: hypothetical protein M2R45_02071 [Verrucomicrobia subdivision 3 bacterium]|nr:hypothetical protein [Limisphaerales bacterium]MCS1413870.1 hypothetical protein [Limisphaerales bacterium]